MSRLRRALVPLLVVASGVATAYLLVANRPQAAQVESETPATFVEITNAEPGRRAVVIEAMGVVQPEKQVVVQPEVVGRVIEQNHQLVPGGRLAAGDPMLRIDARDYTAAVAATKAELARARLAAREEATLKRVAEHEWRETPKGFSEETLAYALREPHLDAAHAQVSSAKSRMAKARRDLERTIVRAPFDALVQSEAVDVGQSVGPQTPIATLVGLERYWVVVSVPVAQLRAMYIPGVNTDEPLGSVARIVNEAADDDRPREGHVVRLLGSVDQRGRMARVVVAVDDPLGLHTEVGQRPAPLLLDTYVRVRIEGRAVDDVVSVTRSAVQSDGRIWIVDDESRLRPRPSEIVWRERGRVLVRGLEAGERVVTTPLPVATDGMKVTIAAPVDDDDDDDEPASEDG